MAGGRLWKGRLLVTGNVYNCYMSLFPILIPDRLLVENCVMVVVVELVVECVVVECVVVEGVVEESLVVECVVKECVVVELEDGTILSRQSV